MDSPLSCVVETIKSHDLKARVLDHSGKQGVREFDLQAEVDLLFSLFFLGAFQPDDEGNSESELLRGLDNTFGNVITAHNATKDIDKDALDFGIGEQDFERLFDSLGGSTSIPR